MNSQELRDALIYIDFDSHWVGWSNDAMADMRRIGKAARKYVDLPEQVQIVAGLLSTIDFQPSQHHPVQMEPMAKRIINVLLEDIE